MYISVKSKQVIDGQRNEFGCIESDAITSSIIVSLIDIICEVPQIYNRDENEYEEMLKALIKTHHRPAPLLMTPFIHIPVWSHDVHLQPAKVVHHPNVPEGHRLSIERSLKP